MEVIATRIYELNISVSFTFEIMNYKYESEDKLSEIPLNVHRSSEICVQIGKCKENVNTLVRSKEGSGKK